MKHRQSRGRWIETEYLYTKRGKVKNEREDDFRLNGDSVVIGTALSILAWFLLWVIYSLVTA